MRQWPRLQCDATGEAALRGDKLRSARRPRYALPLRQLQCCIDAEGERMEACSRQTGLLAGLSDSVVDEWWSRFEMMRVEER